MRHSVGSRIGPGGHFQENESQICIVLNSFDTEFRELLENPKGKSAKNILMIFSQRLCTKLRRYSLGINANYILIDKKNREPIATINHEVLNGLAVASEWTPEDPEELKEPRYFYDDYKELVLDVEVRKKIKIGTPIVFTYDFGNGLKYQSEVTTYGKIRISKILERNMDDFDFTKDKYTRFDAKSAMKLSAFLYDYPDDGIEKRLELQKFCLRVVSLAGVVTFDFPTLFCNVQTKTYEEIRNIADSPDLTDQQKLVLLTEKYEQYEKEVEASFSEDLKNELSRAGRVKISSISALNMPQLIVSGINETPIITRGSLLTGLSERDMIFHSIENRSLQSIKVSGVKGYTRIVTVRL